MEEDGGVAQGVAPSQQGATRGIVWHMEEGRGAGWTDVRRGRRVIPAIVSPMVEAGDVLFFHVLPQLSGTQAIVQRMEEAGGANTMDVVWQLHAVAISVQATYLLSMLCENPSM
jgi:hypothetical protein